LNVSPFRNTIVIAELTGSEIICMLEFAVKIGALIGGWLHTSGLTCDFRGKNVRNILINGEKLVSDKIYTLSTTDYIVSGGDGYSMFSNKKLVQTGFLLTDVISDFFKKNILLKSYDSNKRIIRD
ncbi:5'-nucleotidase C-terminal domain-containing protein, partial [Candidatus Dependentiae bacterium]|nr:5'-nucleotidase C-terminal domain-containing protein [Candidatus Dependentiae bacterium]